MNENLSINLSNDISYVYGKVNGVEADFTLSAPGIWSTTVDKSLDGKYLIEITVYNNAGTYINYNTAIYKLDKILGLKTDWTSEEYYNLEDFNRVEINTQFLKDYLARIGYKTKDLEFIIDRNYNNIDFLSSINRIENNIENIKNSFITPPNYLGNKAWTFGLGFSYVDANRLEKNLEQLYFWAQKTEESFLYCGQINCGEGGTL